MTAAATSRPNEVRHRATGTSSWTLSGALGSSTLSYEIGVAGQTAPSTRCRCRPPTTQGDSGWSASSSSTKATTCNVPSKPAAPSLTVGNAKLTASWSAPADGGCDITGYKVRHSATGTNSWSISGALGSSTLSYEIGSLVNGTEYEVQVQAANRRGRQHLVGL